MTSQAQKNSGYPIPEEHVTEETQSFCIIIPAGDEFRQAAYAQLSMLGKWWRWKHNESPESTRARETAETWRLLFEFNEDCGGFDMTPEELKEVMIEANYIVVNRVAAQIVSGRWNNISVGEDGTVTDPTTAQPDDEVPPDDEDTPDINEGLEAQNGGSVRVVDYLQQILTNMQTWFAGTVTEQQAADRLELIYGFEAAAATTFANYYYTVYAGATGVISLNETILDSLFFCRGVSISTFSRYIFNNHITEAEVPTLEVLAENLTQTQLTNWFNEGTQFPAKFYETYSCTKIATEETTLDMSTAEVVIKNLSGVWKNGHRYRVQVTGSFTDSDNPGIVKDAFWSHDTSTGTKTFEGAAFISTGGVVNLTAAEVPFQPSHAYNVIVEKGGGNAAGQLTRNNNPFNLPNTTGILTATITDEGEFGV